MEIQPEQLAQIIEALEGIKGEICSSAGYIFICILWGLLHVVAFRALI